MLNSKGAWLLFTGFIILFQCALTDNNFKYDCFKDSKEGVCEDTRVKICGDFFACDLVIKLDSPPKRIGHRNGDILFSSGGKTYGITNGSDHAEQVNRVITPPSDLYDKNGNIYYGGDGTTYFVEGGTGKEIEIISSGSYSYNQHALDTETNKLFILSFRSDTNPHDRTGQIYAVNTDPLNIVNDKVQAELVSGAGDRITALAVQEGVESLVLGIKENDGGKLIILKRQKYDPCSQKESHKNALFKLIKEMEAKVIELLDTSPEPISKSNLLTKTNDKEVISLSRENQRLKRELGITKDKIKMFSEKMMGFSKAPKKRISHKKSEPGEIMIIDSQSMLPDAEPNYSPYPTTPRSYTSTHIPTSSTLPDDGVIIMPIHHMMQGNLEPIECLERSTLNRLRQENYFYKKNLENQENEFRDLIQNLDIAIGVAEN